MIGITLENKFTAGYKCRSLFSYVKNSPLFFNSRENRFKEKVLFCDYPYSFEMDLQRNDYNVVEERMFLANLLRFYRRGGEMDNKEDFSKFCMPYITKILRIAYKNEN